MAFNYSPKVITDGLVLYLDAANPKSYVSGSTTWGDLSRSGNNGTLINGVGYNSSNLGSLSFDGIDDYVQCPNINPGNSLSVDVWFNKISGTGFQGILGNWNSTGPGDSWLITQNSGNRSSFYVRFNASSGDDIIDTTTTISSNVWYNYTGTFSNSTLSLYRNGILVNSKSTLQNTIFQNLLNIWVGRFSTLYFSGLIPIGRVYNRALSAQEILQNYNATKTRFGL
jgi:hypothetical protein